MITNADKSAVYMTGTLGSGDLQTIGTVAGGYTAFTTDITDIVITDAGKALGSAALNSILYTMTPGLDFELSLQGGSGTNYHSFAEMLAGGPRGRNTRGALTTRHCEEPMPHTCDNAIVFPAGDKMDRPRDEYGVLGHGQSSDSLGGEHSSEWKRESDGIGLVLPRSVSRHYFRRRARTVECRQ